MDLKTEEVKLEPNPEAQSNVLILRPRDDKDGISEPTSIPPPVKKAPKRRSKNAVKGPILL